MVDRAWTFLRLAGPALAIVHLSGCTLIAASYGAGVDARRPDENIFAGHDLADLDTGAEVDVTLETGETVSGEYQKVGYGPSVDFAERYQLIRSQATSSEPLPALGDSVSVLMDLYGNRQTGEFAGFAGSREVWLRATSQGEPAMPKLFPMRRIRASTGEVLIAGVVERMTLQGTLPLASAMVIRTALGDRYIPVEDIESVRQEVKKHGVLYGLLAGAAIDALVIYAISTFTYGPLNMDFSGGS